MSDDKRLPQKPDRPQPRPPQEHPRPSQDQVRKDSDGGRIERTTDWNRPPRKDKD